MGGSQTLCRQLPLHMGHSGRESEGHQPGELPRVPEWMVPGLHPERGLSLRAEDGSAVPDGGNSIAKSQQQGRAKSWITVWRGQGREKRLEGRRGWSRVVWRDFPLHLYFC